MDKKQDNMTTIKTKSKAESLSLLLYGEINKTCKHYISLGETECKAWINRLCKRYNIIT